MTTFNAPGASSVVSIIGKRAVRFYNHFGWETNTNLRYDPYGVLLLCGNYAVIM
jgi:hypothetical protein